MSPSVTSWPPGRAYPPPDRAHIEYWLLKNKPICDSVVSQGEGRSKGLCQSLNCPLR